ncbi:hypothetical protein [Leptospira stimsonii]|uniref:Uncharacterized protein n=1 Tax=Leptospira stimsonii TaxID=2202203 RepID=A0A4R9LAT4_9LEPT|nr:hypothetical protein [Leptospira stimsonii]RHX84166.1 hypothetical protein DLM78_19005 [Leptospira stimsonii]TGK26014.1 hypothetical protein EHO98_01295 [Leptospira stimsonii]TGM22447.1 hypothetical protein EHQ90_00625 [Leptospira stimsonii]
MIILRWICFASLILPHLFCLDRQRVDPERNHIFADIRIQRENKTIRLQFSFYREISEILNGQENRGFGKSPLLVDFPKIDGNPLIETERNGIKFYSIELIEEEKEHSISFMRKDGLYKGSFGIPQEKSQNTIQVEFKK